MPAKQGQLDAIKGEGGVWTRGRTSCSMPMICSDVYSTFLAEDEVETVMGVATGDIVAVVVEMVGV